MKQRVDTFGAVRNGNKKLKRSQPVGTITIRRRKQGRSVRTHWSRFIKVRLDGAPKQRWLLFARWWWTKNRGPIPGGQVVYHKDGDEMNDTPENLAVGTFGQKFVAAHARDPEMSRANRSVIAGKMSARNRMQARINRTKVFTKDYWYPVIDELSLILNVAYRSRKRLLAGFGADVSRYPANGYGKHTHSKIQRAIRGTSVKPVRSGDLTQRVYQTYCLLDPDTRMCRGPMSTSPSRIIAQLHRMGIWQRAEKQAKRDVKERT